MTIEIKLGLKGVGGGYLLLNLMALVSISV